MKNIAAYTPPTPLVGLVPFISVNELQDGSVQITIRSAPHGDTDGVMAHMELSYPLFLDLLRDMNGYCAKKR